MSLWGEILGGLAGAAIGFVVSGGNPMGALYGFGIGSAIGGALTAAGGQDTSGPRLDDLDVTDSSYGSPIKLVYGTERVAADMIWTTGKIEEVHKEKYQTGGFLGFGGSSTTYKWYTYSLTAAYALCEGPIIGIRRIWINNELVYNISDTVSPLSIAGSTKLAKQVNVFHGGEDQEPSPLQESIEGAGNVPAYKGLAYIEFKNLELERFGNGALNVEVEVVKSNATVNGAPSIVDTWDATILNVRASVYQDGVIRSSLGGGSTASGDEYPSKPWVDHTVTTFDLEGNILKTEKWAMKVLNGTGFFDGQPYQWEIKNDPYTICTGNGTEGGVTGTFTAIYHRGIRVSDQAYPTDQKNSIFGGKDYAAYGEESIRLDYLNGDPEYLYAPYVCWSGSYNTPANSNIPKGIAVYASELGQYPVLERPIRWRLSKDINDGTEVAYNTINIDAGGNRFFWCTQPDSTRRVMRMDETLNVLNYWGSAATGLPGVFYRTHYFNGTTGLCLRDAGNGTSIVRLYSFDPTTTNSEWVEIGAVSCDAIEQYTSTDVMPLTDSLVMGRIDLLTVVDLVPAGTDTVGNIIADLCYKAGVAVDDLDVTDMTDVIRGYKINRVSTARGAINPLLTYAYGDGYEVDGKLKFTKRGAAAVRTLNSDDLSATPYGSQQEKVKIVTRLDQLTLPKSCSVSYRDVDSNYDVVSQLREKINTQSQEKTEVRMPMSMQAGEAAKLADIILYSAYAERPIQFWAGPENMDLTPGDVVNIDDSTTRVRIEEVTLDPTFRVGFTGKQEYVNAYASVYSGHAALSAAEKIAFSGGPTDMYLMDIPSLGALDTEARLRIGATGYYAEWNGCTLWRSDVGDEFVEFAATTSDAPAGTTTDLLGDFTGSGWDGTNSVNVSLGAGDVLTSDTKDNILANGNNLAAIGIHGRWEIIRFATATLETDGTYTLTDLVRGEFGTEHNIGNHVIADQFCLLNDTLVAAASYNSQVWYKGVTFALDPVFAQAVPFTSDAKNLAPYSPVHITGTRDGSNNLTIDWVSRDRAEYVNNFLNRMSEATEDYEVDIINGSGTIVRTITTTASANGSVVTPGSQTCYYDVADQTLDSGITPGDPIDVAIYQLSAVVGRGGPGEATV